MQVIKAKTAGFCFGVKRAVQPPGFVGGLTAIDKACRAWPNVQKRRAKHANPSVILLAPNRFGDIARGQFQNAVCNKPICHCKSHF